MSIRQQQAALCYHLGVREHMQQQYNVVVHNCQHALTNDGVVTNIKVSAGRFAYCVFE
jgi:hypothetical protein